MGSVWVTVPSARPVEEVNRWAANWRERGYFVAILRDDPRNEIMALPSVNAILSALPDGYRGYARSANALIQFVLERDSACDFCIAGGDDTDPDPHRTAEEISLECRRHFHNYFAAMLDGPWESMSGRADAVANLKSGKLSTFGVMQPTGDRFAQGSIDRIAGSPWIGREFARRVYQGQGPYWPEYTSMFVDEELKCVAEKYGVYWMRPDLVHLHRHFMRESDALDSRAVARPIPPHLIEANSPEHWAKFKALFESRKIHGFPGSELLP